MESSSRSGRIYITRIKTKIIFDGTIFKYSIKKKYLKVWKFILFSWLNKSKFHKTKNDVNPTRKCWTIFLTISRLFTKKNVIKFCILAAHSIISHAFIFKFYNSHTRKQINSFKNKTLNPPPEMSNTAVIEIIRRYLPHINVFSFLRSFKNCYYYRLISLFNQVNSYQSLL